MSENYEEQINQAVELICKNYNLPVGLNITPIVIPHYDNSYIAFLDAATSMTFCDGELHANFKNGIHSKKDYRKLRSLIRLRLADAAWSLKCLAEETLKNLGQSHN